jgi:hypothetical protein
VAFTVGAPDDADAPADPGGAPSLPRVPGSEAAWPRIRSMPPSPPAGLRPPVPIDTARATRPTPARPSTLSGTRPPVPPQGSEPWQTRTSGGEITGPGAAETPPGRPDGSPAIAFPVEPDDTPA